MRIKKHWSGPFASQEEARQKVKEYRIWYPGYHMHVRRKGGQWRIMYWLKQPKNT